VQTMRKEAGFEVTDKICLGYNGTNVIESILQKNSDEICAEVFAVSATKGIDVGFSKKWNLSGEDITLFVAKV